jgi:hypothetical protein
METEFVKYDGNTELTAKGLNDPNRALEALMNLSVPGASVFRLDGGVLIQLMRAKGKPPIDWFELPEVYPLLLKSRCSCQLKCVAWWPLRTGTPQPLPYSSDNYNIGPLDNDDRTIDLKWDQTGDGYFMPVEPTEDVPTSQSLLVPDLKSTVEDSETHWLFCKAHFPWGYGETVESVGTGDGKIKEFTPTLSHPVWPCTLTITVINDREPDEWQRAYRSPNMLEEPGSDSFWMRLAGDVQTREDGNTDDPWQWASYYNIRNGSVTVRFKEPPPPCSHIVANYIAMDDVKFAWVMMPHTAPGPFAMSLPDFCAHAQYAIDRHGRIMGWWYNSDGSHNDHANGWYSPWGYPDPDEE